MSRGRKGKEEKSPQYGGTGGGPFDDAQYIGNPIRQIKLWYGQYVDAIQVTYGDVQADKHGGGGGTPVEISLEDEKIIAVFLKAGQFINQILFVTLSNDNKKIMTHGPYGGDGGGNHYIIVGTVDDKIDAFFGQSGQYLDAIGIWAQPPITSA